MTMQKGCLHPLLGKGSIDLLNGQECGAASLGFHSCLAAGTTIQTDNGAKIWANGLPKTIILYAAAAVKKSNSTHLRKLAKACGTIGATMKTIELKAKLLVTIHPEKSSDIDHEIETEAALLSEIAINRLEPIIGEKNGFQAVIRCHVHDIKRDESNCDHVWEAVGRDMFDNKNIYECTKCGVKIWQRKSLH